MCHNNIAVHKPLIRLCLFVSLVYVYAHYKFIAVIVPLPAHTYISV